MKLLLKFSMLFSMILIFSGFAGSIDVAELINKAKARESENENKIGDFIKVETLQKTIEPKQADATYYKKGIKTRVDTSLVNKGKRISSILIYDGKDNWTITGKMKIKSPQVAGDKSKGGLENKKLVDYINKNCKIERMVRIAGRDCYVVSAKIVENSSVNGKVLMWVDKDNFNTYEQLIYDKHGKEMQRTVFSDFRKVCEGVSAPFKTEVYEKGKFLSRSVVKSYKINQQLSDDLFDASKFKAPELSEMMKNLKEQQKILEKQKK